MLNELLKDLWNSNKESCFRKAVLEILLYKEYKEESITVEEKALEYFIDEIKNSPYFFFNALKDCDSKDLKNIINS